MEGLELGLPPGHLADLKEHRQRRGLPAGDAAAAAMRGSAVQVQWVWLGGIPWFPGRSLPLLCWR